MTPTATMASGTPALGTGLLTDDRLTFDQTVPRAIVDRGDSTTVLLTSWVRHDKQFAAAACWPRLGGYYTLLEGGTHDPMLVLETFRQVALLMAHVVEDVPLATMQVMRSFHFTADPQALRLTAEPTEVKIIATWDRNTHGAIMQTEGIGEMYRGDRLIGRAVGKAVVPPGEMYLRVRGRDPQEVDLARIVTPPSLPPLAAGRELARDVVISPGADPQQFLIRIDPEHPNFFDNPTDHTPGMLLTEAMRQAIIAYSGDPHTIPVSANIRFQRFVELDSPASVTVRRSGAGFRSEIQQFGKRAASAEWHVQTARADADE